MTPFRKLASAAVLAALVAGAGTANAGWSNVFQLCCDSCKSSTSAYGPVAAVPVSDPTPCTTRYIQRSYYQPVTTYRTSYYMEPVTSYRTSYFYEPVTSYRVSSYYDPNICGYAQVTTPVVSYRLRSQTCPVQSYVQKAVVQPVQSYQLSYYFEPQTTCCQTTIGAPIAAIPAPGAVAVPLAPAPQGAPAAQGPPTVNDQRQPQLGMPPGVTEERGAPQSNESQRYPAPPSSQPMPKASDSSSFRPTVPAPPAVRLDRIVSATSPSLQGSVVGQDSRPIPNVQLLFIQADQLNNRETAKADAAGKFEVPLSAGSWLVYTQTPDGKTEFRRKIEVRADERTEVQLVSR
jgi:hypothetical protein